MSNWRTEEKKRIQQFKDYTAALEKREKFLIEALTELSRGCGRKVEGYEWHVAMTKLAAERLGEAALIRVPEKGWL